MNDHSIPDPTEEIPYGFCQCGCGHRTSIAKRNDKRDGTIKGQPKRFVSGHNWARPIPANPNPSGLCMCGCGQPVPLAKRNSRRNGHAKGQPIRYLPGHHRAKGIWPKPPNPDGLCLCGCGQKTPIATQSDLLRGNIKGYPMRYMPRHNARQSLEDRFWAKVERRGPDDCWFWIGSKNTHGYGQLSVNGKPQMASRISWEIHNGPIPQDKEVCHNCPGEDRPACVNPAHLWLGTHRENLQDMVSKRNRH